MCVAASDEPSPGDGAEGTVNAHEGYSRKRGLGARMARRVILGYQSYVSPLKMGPTCRFEPTCSNYALIAIGRHGLIKGSILTLGRLARCGPWHPGGWDPVPPRRPLRLWSRRHR